MLGTGLQFRGNRRGDNRFYIPVNKRNMRNQNSQNQQREAQQLRRAKSDVTTCSSSPMKEDGEEEQSGGGKKMEKQAVLCNLERFLGSITPSVPALYLSKTTMRGWKTCDVEFQPYFELRDLWESFQEWSVYGAGVPLVLNGSDSVVQYYVPYLSGIQIYIDSLESPLKSRRPGEDSDSDYFRDSSSDGSSDCEPERALKHTNEQHHHWHPTNEATFGMDRLSLRNRHVNLQGDYSSDEGESVNSLGCLSFEYFERDPPYSRIPLADKISDLAVHNSELMTLRSCDILSSSWLSVAWYPIYRIPTGPTLKDLDACFLTFHSLRTPIKGSQNALAPVVTYPGEMDGVSKISLPQFGLATYKFKGSLWVPDRGSEHKLVTSLTQAADDWLRLHQVNHPDFHFFCSR